MRNGSFQFSIMLVTFHNWQIGHFYFPFTCLYFAHVCVKSSLSGDNFAQSVKGTPHCCDALPHGHAENMMPESSGNEV